MLTRCAPPIFHKMLYLLSYTILDFHGDNDSYFHLLGYDTPASVRWKSMYQTTCRHNTEYCNMNIAFFSFYFRALVYVGQWRYNKEYRMYCRETCYYSRSLGIELLCFYYSSCRISLMQHCTKNYARNCPLGSQMLMSKNQISQVRCRVETILWERSENPSFFHHFLYNKGLFYKTIKLNSALMCPLAAAGACLLEA